MTIDITGSNWFLLVLFENGCLLSLAWYLCKWFKASKYDCFFLLAIFVVVKLTNSVLQVSELGLGLLSWYCFFYFMGYMYSKYKDVFTRYKLVTSVVVIILAVIILPMWRREQTPIYMLYISRIIDD